MRSDMMQALCLGAAIRGSGLGGEYGGDTVEVTATIDELGEAFASTAPDWETLGPLFVPKVKVDILRAVRALELASAERVREALRIGGAHYHVGDLTDKGLLVVERTVPRRGSTERLLRVERGVVVDAAP